MDHGPDHELVVVVSLKTGEITAEKLSSLTGIGVYVTGQTGPDSTRSDPLKLQT